MYSIVLWTFMSKGAFPETKSDTQYSSATGKE